MSPRTIFTRPLSRGPLALSTSQGTIRLGDVHARARTCTQQCIHYYQRHDIRSLSQSSSLTAKRNPSPVAQSIKQLKTIQPVAQYRPTRASDIASSHTKPESKKPPPIFIWGLSATLFSAALFYSYVRMRQADTAYDSDPASGNGASEKHSSLAALEGADLSKLKDPSARYRETASSFDAEVSSAEKWSGINRLRKKLARKAFGHVLEVSAGTGRNSEFYELSKCRSITFLDQAAEMTEISRSKFYGDGDGEAGGRVRAYRKARFVTQSALEDDGRSIAAPPGGFDTVVQTFGLCSTGDPVGLLRNMGRLVKQDGSGRILLLEHGRGLFGFVNNLLDKSAPAHAAKHGCWWNRDIATIVRDSGLEIVREKRYLLHFGTTYWYELKPSSATQQDPNNEEEKS